MTREEIQKWKAILKEKNPLGLPDLVFEIAWDERKGEFWVELNIAKFIKRLLPDLEHEALKIYLELLTSERIDAEIQKAKQQSESSLEEDRNFADCIEELINGCLNVADSLYRLKQDVSQAMIYVDKGLKLLEENEVVLLYTSKEEFEDMKQKLESV